MNAPTKNESLPELPEASVSVNENGVVMAGLPTPAMVPYWANTTPYYTKDQMLAYGRACAALTREAPTEGVAEPVFAGYDPGEDDREAEDYHVIMTMGRLLAAIAISVRGPEPAGTAWSYHDLPDIVAALQEAAEQVADEMTAWAAAKMADRGSSRRDRLMIREWAKRLRNPETFPVKDFEVEGTTLTKEEMRAIVRKVIATPPAPQRLAQGNRPSNCRESLREAGKPYPKSGCAVCRDGGLRGCPYTTQPPHHDWGEVEQRARELQERCQVSAAGNFKPNHAVVPLIDFQSAIRIALTEAKQQGPGEAVWLDDLRAVLDAADAASAVPLTWLANTDFTPDQTKAWLIEAVNGNVEAGDFSGELHSIAEEESGLVVAFTGCGPKSAANAKFLIWCVHFILKHRDALTAPQVEAKRQMGEVECPKFAVGDRVTWTNKFGTSFPGVIEECWSGPIRYCVALDDGTIAGVAYESEIAAAAKPSGEESP